MKPLALLLLALLPTASSLRCNTYLATDFSSSGTGTESCLQGVTRCIQREAWPLGVRTYSMSCDDLFQCVDVKPGSCCTKRGSIGGGVVVRCATENFNKTRINATDFDDDPSCSQNCTSQAYSEEPGGDGNPSRYEGVSMDERGGRRNAGPE